MYQRGRTVMPLTVFIKITEKVQTAPPIDNFTWIMTSNDKCVWLLVQFILKVIQIKMNKFVFFGQKMAPKPHKCP
jgi:hypothetical protein